MMSIKLSTLQDNMLEKDIDPPPGRWLDDDGGSLEYEEWLDNLAQQYEDRMYQENEAALLHAYECKVYNEKYRGLRI